MFSNTCGDTQPVNPAHVDAKTEKKTASASATARKTKIAAHGQCSLEIGVGSASRVARRRPSVPSGRRRGKAEMWFFSPSVASCELAARTLARKHGQRIYTRCQQNVLGFPAESRRCDNLTDWLGKNAYRNHCMSTAKKKIAHHVKRIRNSCAVHRQTRSIA